MKENNPQQKNAWYNRGDGDEQDQQANSYCLTPAVLEAVEHMYDHSCSLEFIIETIREAYRAGQEEQS